MIGGRGSSSRRPLPSRAQVVTALAVALLSYALLAFGRGYPPLLASLSGGALGALTYSGWGTVRRLRGIYGGRPDADDSRQGNSTNERTKSP